MRHTILRHKLSQAITHSFNRLLPSVSVFRHWRQLVGDPLQFLGILEEHQWGRHGVAQRISSRRIGRYLRTQAFPCFPVYCSSLMLVVAFLSPPYDTMGGAGSILEL